MRFESFRLRLRRNCSCTSKASLQSLLLNSHTEEVRYSLRSRSILCIWGALGPRQLSARWPMTSTSSHELCEAITDPIPGEGWYDDANGEIGDICAWQTRLVGEYTVQLEWSNKNNQCK